MLTLREEGQHRVTGVSPCHTLVTPVRSDKGGSGPMLSSSLRSPIALPRHSWKGTLKRTVTEFRRDKLIHWGAALTYYAVLSLFPALLVLVSLVGLFADPARVTRVMTDTVSQLGPATASK